VFQKECINGGKTLPRNCLQHVEVEGVFKEKYERWHGVLILTFLATPDMQDSSMKFPILKSNGFFSILLCSNNAEPPKTDLNLIGNSYMIIKFVVCTP
jgi:hypothetical protein